MKFLLKFIYIKITNFSKFFSRKGLYIHLKKEIEKLPKIKLRTLTIGSGGDTEKFIKENYPNIDLLSIDNQSIKNPDILMDVNKLEFDEETFDLVFILEVIEHLQEPKIAIDQIYRVLKSNGTIILSTPFILETHGAPNDYYRFTKYGLKYLLNKFNDIKIKERNSYFDSIIVLYIRLIRSRYISDRFIGLFFLSISLVFYPLIYILSKIIRSDLITTGYVCSARK